MANISIELSKMKEEIEGLAKGFGLDFFPLVFEVLDFEKLNEVAAYGGFPTRYPHWSFGMEYEQLSKGYEYGLSKIYEMVINNDPCYAYLLRSNPMVDQKLVMAHVYGHSDFFKNNYWFSQTDRNMMDTTANHAAKIRKYIDRYGFDQVESFLDVCLSLNNLIDPHAVFVKDDVHSSGFESQDPKESAEERLEDFFKKQRQVLQHKPQDKALPLQKDTLAFLIAHAPLEFWQRDVLHMIRKEAYYFAPQGQTKIMNEGWASYWHAKMMTEHLLSPSEWIDYADHHSGAMATNGNQINPYKLGIELFRDIEQRWNKGQFGKAYNECNNMQEKMHWDQKLGLGRDKIFEVRKIYNDVMFVDEFFTETFCLKHKFFSFSYNAKTQAYDKSSRSFQEIKRKILFSLTNMGQPTILVKDANVGGRNELMLWHQYSGIDLKVDWAYATLENIYKVWKRPVHLHTKVEDKGKLLSFDGKERKSTQADYID